MSKLINKSFLTRTLSGALLILIILIAFIFGGDILLGFTFLISIIGFYEICKIFNIEFKPLGIVGYIGTIVYYFMMRFGFEKYLMAFIVLYLMALLIVFVVRFPRYKTDQVTMALFGMIYTVIMLSYIYRIREMESGAYLVWLIILCSWGCDTFAYLVGMTIGKHKLAPVLSPKKSIEGSIGGVVASIILGVVYTYIFREHFTMFNNPMLCVGIICGVTSIISQLGDLAASGIKRNYDIKDYGKLIPGHGGVLDRFDSVIFTSPVIFFFIINMMR